MAVLMDGRTFVNHNRFVIFVDHVDHMMTKQEGNGTHLTSAQATVSGIQCMEQRSMALSATAVSRGLGWTVSAYCSNEMLFVCMFLSFFLSFFRSFFFFFFFFFFLSLFKIADGRSNGRADVCES